MWQIFRNPIYAGGNLCKKEKEVASVDCRCFISWYRSTLFERVRHKFAANFFYFLSAANKNYTRTFSGMISSPCSSAGYSPTLMRKMYIIVAFSQAIILLDVSDLLKSDFYARNTIICGQGKQWLPPDMIYLYLMSQIFNIKNTIRYLGTNFFNWIQPQMPVIICCLLCFKDLMRE